MEAKALKDMFIHVATRVVQNEDFLTEIDSKIGDGDHGIGMSVGFKNVKQVLEAGEFNSIEEVFQCVGMTLLDTMGGASGVLFGTMFISGIIGRTPRQECELRDFAQIFRKSLEALKQRGKAKIGDKTMIDSLEPAVVALEKGVKQGDTLIEGIHLTAQAAKDGVEYSKTCIAKYGRAKSYGSKSLGVQDAGATSVWIIFNAMAEWIGEKL